MKIYLLLTITLLLNIVVYAHRSRVNETKTISFIPDVSDKDKDQDKGKGTQHSQVRISPQTIGDRLYIDNLSGQSVEISIVNIIGVPVYTGKSHTINLENIPSGLYILIVKEGDNISSTKFYKK